MKSAKYVPDLPPQSKFVSPSFRKETTFKPYFEPRERRLAYVLPEFGVFRSCQIRRLFHTAGSQSEVAARYQYREVTVKAGVHEHAA